MTLEFRPLSDALGAEVVGGDFTKSVIAGDVDKLKNAFLKYHLLCLRSAPLSAKALFQVASYFGTPFSAQLADSSTKSIKMGSPKAVKRAGDCCPNNRPTIAPNNRPQSLFKISFGLRAIVRLFIVKNLKA